MSVATAAAASVAFLALVLILWFIMLVPFFEARVGYIERGAAACS
ncbi:MAG TPA: hypothetical protein VIT65_25610 [Microlunatus sp.]